MDVVTNLEEKMNICIFNKYIEIQDIGTTFQYFPVVGVGLSEGLDCIFTSVYSIPRKVAGGSLNPMVTISKKGS